MSTFIMYSLYTVGRSLNIQLYMQYCYKQKDCHKCLLFYVKIQKIKSWKFIVTGNKYRKSIHNHKVKGFFMWMQQSCIFNLIIFARDISVLKFELVIHKCRSM